MKIKTTLLTVLMSLVAVAQEPERLDLPPDITFRQILPEIRVVDGREYNVAYVKYWESKRGRYGPARGARVASDITRVRPMKEWQYLQGKIVNKTQNSIVIQSETTKVITAFGGRTAETKTVLNPAIEIKNHPWVESGKIGEPIGCYAMRLKKARVGGYGIINVYDFGTRKEIKTVPKSR